MKLKLLVGTMAIMGLVSTSVFADVSRVQPQAGAVATTTTPDLVMFWENTVDRNEDNANGIILNQQNHVSAAISTQASYTSKRGSADNLNTTASPYTDTSPNNKGNTSLYLANAEVYFDSQVTPWARAHIATTYGPDFTGSNYGNFDMFFDEAYAELNNFQQNPSLGLFAKVGRQYLNFGSTQYNVITEPLTNDLSLTNATAVTVGAIANNGVYGDFYGYNGNQYGGSADAKADSSNTIHGWGAEVGYAMSNAAQSFNAYADYIANIADSLSFNNSLGTYSANQQGTTVWTSIFPDQQRPGYALHANYTMGAFGVIADYVGMVSAFDKNIYSYNGHGASLSAYALEADYTLPTQNVQMISLGYQGSENALSFYGLGNPFSMPKSRIVAGYKYVFTSNINMKFEYMYDKDYAKTDVATNGTGSSTLNTYAGSGASNNTVLARLNVMF